MKVTLYDLNNLWERGGQYALGTYTCVREAFEHVIGGGSVTFMASALGPLSLLAADADLAAAPRPHGDSAVYQGLKLYLKIIHIIGDVFFFIFIRKFPGC